MAEWGDAETRYQQNNLTDRVHFEIERKKKKIKKIKKNTHTKIRNNPTHMCVCVFVWRGDVYTMHQCSSQWVQAYIHTPPSTQGRKKDHPARAEGYWKQTHL